MKIFVPPLATVERVPVEVGHLGENKAKEITLKDRWGGQRWFVEGRELWRISGESRSTGMERRVTKLFSRKFQGVECRFSSHCCFSLTITLPWYLPDHTPGEKPTIHFFSICCPGSKEEKDPRLQLGEAAPAREKTVGLGDAAGPSCSCWGRMAGGKVPADLQPFLGSGPCKHLSCRVYSSVCCSHQPCQPAACPGATPMLPVERPRCPASSWFWICWIFTFFFKVWVIIV